MRKGFVGLLILFILGIGSGVLIYLGLTKHKQIEDTIPLSGPQLSSIPTLFVTTNQAQKTDSVSQKNPSPTTSKMSQPTSAIIQYTLTPTGSYSGVSNPTSTSASTKTPTPTTKGKGNGGGSGTGIVTGG